MAIWNPARLLAKKAVDRKRLSRSRSARLSLECLEQRLTPSRGPGPALVVITHGFEIDQDGNGGLNDARSAWVDPMKHQVIQALTSNQSQSAPTTVTIREVGPSSWDLDGIPSNSNLIVLVNWKSMFGGSEAPALDLADSIRHFLNTRFQSENETWDLLFIGHSRGAIFNGEVTADLAINPPPMDYVETISLDPTAVLGLDPIHAFPAVSSEVGRAIDYDDRQALLPGITFDGYRQGSPNPATQVLNVDVGDVVDSYLPAPEFNFFLRDPHLSAAVDSASALEVPGAEAIGLALDANEFRHSYNSHVGINEWYLDTENRLFTGSSNGSKLDQFYSDLRGFLLIKDANTAPASIDDGPGSAVPGTQKSELAHVVAEDQQNAQVPPANTRDDYPQPIGPASTRIHLDSQGTAVLQVGRIDWSGDRDYFQFIASRSGLLVVSAKALQSPLDSYLRLYRFDGTSAAPPNDNGGGGKDASITIQDAVAGRTYLVEVSGQNATQGNYRLDISQPEHAPLIPGDHPPASAPPPDDFPDRPGDAVPIVLGKQLIADKSGRIDDATHPSTFNGKDHDWFEVTVPRDGKLRIELFTPHSSLDQNIRLHASDPNLTLLVQGTGPILRPVTAGQTFFIDIGAALSPTAGLDPTGQYTLRVSMPSDSAIPPEDPVQDTGEKWLASVPKVPIPLLGGNGSSRGGIDDPGEVDWFRITGPHAGNMLVTVAGVNDDLKEFVTAFRDDGSGIDTDSGEFDGNATVGFTVGANETILVAVSSANGASTGTYTVTVSQPTNLPDDDL